MSVRINYELNGGIFFPKDEVKEAFYTDLYHFVNDNYETELKTIPLEDFIVAEPYIIGNTCGKYFLKEIIGGTLEEQPDTHFIGYLYKNNKYLELIPHLIHFFALWREIEGCREPHATDFFASSWAALVDTAKFFKYTTVEDLEKSPESPTVRCEPILNSLQTCPGLYETPYVVSQTEDTRLPKPKKEKYEFLGWYDNPNFEGEAITHILKTQTQDITVYARWGTHTFFHSNDGYATFDDLYTDFLSDFSEAIGIKVTKAVERINPHGPVSDFCKVSYNGNLNKFFAIEQYYNKWIWMIEHIRSLKSNAEEVQNKFVFKDGKFGCEAQVRWELNSLFVTRFHIVWPKTNDYSGVGVKEKFADITNSAIIKVKYPVGEKVVFPKVSHKDGLTFCGWFNNPDGLNEEIKSITDDSYATEIVYAKWRK